MTFDSLAVTNRREAPSREAHTGSDAWTLSSTVRRQNRRSCKERDLGGTGCANGLDIPPMYEMNTWVFGTGCGEENPPLLRARAVTKKLDLCCERFINRTESTVERPAEMVSIAGRATKVTR